MKKAFFISDLHLGAAYHKDDLALQKSVVAFLDNIRDEAAEIYLLGDILDYWFEYRHVVPRGFVRFFGKLAELSDQGIKITWIIGNHDIWIFDYLPSELGIEVVDGVVEREILGVPFSLQHGDAIGGNAKFRFMRGLFRNKICQKLYSGLHPRLTVGFAIGCSRRSRMNKKGGMATTPALIDKITEWCKKQINNGNPAKYFLFGHLHQYHDLEISPGRRLIVLSDWPSSHQFAVFDGKKLTTGIFK